MKKLLIVVLLVGALISNASFAASDIIETRDLGNGLSLRLNKTAKTVTMMSNQQAVFTADMAANNIYKFDANGSIVETVSLSVYILNQAGGSASAAATITDSFNRMVYSMPERRIQTLASDPYPCMLAPCPPGFSNFANPWRPTWLGGQGPQNLVQAGGLDDPSPELLAYDEALFERWRQGQCTAGSSAGAYALWFATEAAFVAACISSPLTTFGGVAGCAAGFIAATYLSNAMDEAQEDCNTPYPGFGEEW